MGDLMKNYVNLLLGFLFLTGCAVETKTSSDVIEMKKQIFELQKIQGAQSAKLEEIGQRVLLLSDNKTQVAPQQIELPAPKVAEVKAQVERETSGAEKLYAQALA